MKQSSMVVAVGLLSALAVSPAFAQTSGSASTNSANSASNGQFMTHPDANQWLASHLKGMDVYNDQNQKLASIDELLTDQQGQIKAAVLDVGGFLGVGVHRVAVPFSQLQFVNTPVAGGTASANNATVAPANTAVVNTGGANAPGNPTAGNGPSSGLGSNPVGAPNTTADRTNANGTVSNGGAANTRNANVPDHAMLNMTQDQLKNAPAFNYNNS